MPICGSAFLRHEYLLIVIFGTLAKSVTPKGVDGDDSRRRLFNTNTTPAGNNQFTVVHDRATNPARNCTTNAARRPKKSAAFFYWPIGSSVPDSYFSAQKKPAGKTGWPYQRMNGEAALFAEVTLPAIHQTAFFIT